jgi:hypothetical protein
MLPEQRKKIILLMINMFIAIGSFGIIITPKEQQPTFSDGTFGLRTLG